MPVSLTAQVDSLAVSLTLHIRPDVYSELIKPGTPLRKHTENNLWEVGKVGNNTKNNLW